jgi:hypothetical protein
MTGTGACPLNRMARLKLTVFGAVSRKKPELADSYQL